MSKSSLKKELSVFSKDQLLELVLELYDSRKETKEYLEFFLNPNSKALYEKHRIALEKEMKRTKYSRSRARISKIKSLIKNFESFSPDIEYRFQLYRDVFQLFLYFERYYTFTDSFKNGIIFLFEKYLTLAESNLQLDREIAEIQKILSIKDVGHEYIKNLYDSMIREYLNQSRSNLRN